MLRAGIGAGTRAKFNYVNLATTHSEPAFRNASAPINCSGAPLQMWTSHSTKRRRTTSQRSSPATKSLALR